MTDENPPDLMKMMKEGLGEVRDTYMETAREIRDSVSEPLNPGARKLKGRELAMADLVFASDLNKVWAEADATAARFRLPPGMTSRRVWNRLKRAARTEPPEESP